MCKMCEVMEQIIEQRQEAFDAAAVELQKSGLVVHSIQLAAQTVADEVLHKPWSEMSAEDQQTLMNIMGNTFAFGYLLGQRLDRVLIDSEGVTPSAYATIH